MARTSSLLASTALSTTVAVVSGAAMGADLRLPTKAPRPVVPTPFSWTGCYIGGNVGGATARIRQQVDIPGVIVVDGNGDDSGTIGGGQIGCNWQYPSNWVFGIEGDVNFMNLKRSRSFSFTPRGGEETVGALAARLQWLTTVRGRLGFAWDRSLLYATGGLAVGGVKSSVSASWDNGSGVFFGSNSDT